MKQLLFLLSLLLPVVYESKTLACSEPEAAEGLRAINTFKKLDISEEEILKLSNGTETSVSPKIMGVHEISLRCRITPTGKIIPNWQTTFDDNGVRGLTTLNRDNVEAKIRFIVGKLRCNGISVTNHLTIDSGDGYGVRSFAFSGQKVELQMDHQEFNLRAAATCEF